MHTVEITQAVTLSPELRFYLEHAKSQAQPGDTVRVVLTPRGPAIEVVTVSQPVLMRCRAIDNACARCMRRAWRRERAGMLPSQRGGRGGPSNA